jgi:UDP-MurNAc hydroxylase
MKVTFLGHAGLFVETDHGSILCDPWFNPAFFASWFPFPDNQSVDLEAIGHPDFLYISHLHHDHFDPAFLRDHVDKKATVLLPTTRCRTCGTPSPVWGLPASPGPPTASPWT